MKTKTWTVYQVTTGFGANVIFEDSDWNAVLQWERENEGEHPDWRITKYEIKSVVTVETKIK